MVLVGDAGRARVDCLTKPENIVELANFNDYGKFKFAGDLCVEEVALADMSPKSCGGFVGSPKIKKTQKLEQKFMRKSDGPCECSLFCDKLGAMYWTFSFAGMMPRRGEVGWQPYPCICFMKEDDTGDVEIVRTNPHIKMRFGGPRAEAWCDEPTNGGCLLAQYR